MEVSCIAYLKIICKPFKKRKKETFKGNPRNATPGETAQASIIIMVIKLGLRCKEILTTQSQTKVRGRSKPGRERKESMRTKKQNRGRYARGNLVVKELL